MPRLPDATSLGRRPAPRPTRPIVDIDVPQQVDLGAGARALQDFGRNLFGAGANIQARQDRIDQTTLAHAESAFLASQFEAKDEILQDQDYGTYETRLTERLGKAREEIAGTIADPRLRAAFMARTNETLVREQYAIRGVAREKEMDVRQAALNDLTHTNIDLALRTRDPAERQAALENVLAAINGAYEYGAITATDAQKRFVAAREDFTTRWVKTLTPEQQMAALLGGATVPGTPLSPDAATAINAAAGTPEEADWLARVASIEATGNPAAVNPDSGAAGLFQFVSGTADQYGLTDPFDPVQSAQAALRLRADNAAVLRRRLGREPTPAELYLAHQQGGAGAAALLADPDRNAVDVLEEVYGDRRKARAAILQNGGTADMTAGAFAEKWTGAYANAPAALAAENPPQMAGWIESLPPDVRAKLLEEAQSDYVTAQNRKWTEAERAWTIYERTRKVRQDELQREGDDLLASDAMNYGWLAEHRAELDPADYRYFAEHLAGMRTERTDNLIYTGLQRLAMGGADIADDAREALTTRQITRESYDSLMTLQRQMQAQGPAQSTFKRGVDVIEGALKPGPFSMDPAPQQRASLAVEEWARWNEAHPDAPREEADRQRDLIIKSYQVGGQPAELIKRPLYAVGAGADFDAAATFRATQEAFQQGEITQDELLTQAQIIAAHRDAALRMQAGR